VPLAVALALMVLVTISVTVFVAIVGKACLHSRLARVRDKLGRPAVGQRATRLKEDAARKGGWTSIVSQQTYQLLGGQMTGWCVAALDWSRVILIGSHQTYRTELLSGVK
jgi:hypothetical protein